MIGWHGVDMDIIPHVSYIIPKACLTPTLSWWTQKNARAVSKPQESNFLLNAEKVLYEHQNRW